MQRHRFVLPLSTGGSALMAFSGPLGGVQLLVFGPFFVLERLPGWAILPLGVLAVLWLLGAVAALLQAWPRRASDLVLGRDDFVVRGGPARQTCMAFRDVDPRWFELARKPKDLATIRVQDHAMLLFEGQVIAACRDDDEERSLEAIVTTVHALSSQARGRGLPRRTGRAPEVLYCRSCGAPVALGDADESVLSCAHCAAPVSVPTTIRVEFSAKARIVDARARSEQLLRRLLRQPSAALTNGLLLFAVPPIVFGFPIAALLYDELHRHEHRLASDGALALFVAGQGLSYGLLWLLQAHVARRAAVRIVATRFAAVPPAAAGEPFSCRRCSGPLSHSGPEVLLVLCRYCRSENILGTQLVPLAQVETNQAADLGTELSKRTAVERQYRLLALASLAMLAVSAWSVLDVAGSVAVP